MHGNIPYLFDCWADTVVNLLQLNSSIDWQYSAKYLRSMAVAKLTLTTFSYRRHTIYSVFPFDQT